MGGLCISHANSLPHLVAESPLNEMARENLEGGAELALVLINQAFEVVVNSFSQLGIVSVDGPRRSTRRKVPKQQSLGEREPMT